MQPFPPAKNLEPLVGDSIVQIRLDPNSVQILFESGLTLLVQKRLTHECEGQDRYEYQCEAWRDGPALLHRLVQKSVVEIDRQDWSLSITLNDGSILTVHSDNSNFESGHFAHPDGSVVVY
jgi:hypothetical protein